jgi:hypothetical protein
MSKQRKHYSAELKAKVALEAIKGQQTVNFDCGSLQYPSQPRDQLEETGS